jgi:Uma2 family endonuclease
MRICGKFSNYKNSGKEAEKFVNEVILKSSNLKLKKLRIRARDNMRTPEGWIVNSSGQKVALVKIKLITGSQRENADLYFLNQIRETIKKFKLLGERNFTLSIRNNFNLRRISRFK